LVEGDELATLTLAASTAYTVGNPNSATVTIHDDNSPPTVTVTSPDNQASEFPNTDTGTFRVWRTGSTARALTVSFAMSGTATNGNDYQSISTSITIPAGQSFADIPLAAIHVTVVEGDELATLTLAAGTGYTVGSPSSATVTIHDDIPAVTVT